MDASQDANSSPAGFSFLPLQDGGAGADGNRQRQAPEADPVVQQAATALPPTNQIMPAAFVQSGLVQSI